MQRCEAETRVTESLVSLCHGRKECRVAALPSLLNAPGCSGLHVYLKTAYACVSSDIFQEKFVGKHLEQGPDKVEVNERQSVKEEHIILTESNGIGRNEDDQILEEKEEERPWWWHLVSGILQIYTVIKVNC